MASIFSSPVSFMCISAGSVKRKQNPRHIRKMLEQKEKKWLFGHAEPFAFSLFNTVGLLCARFTFLKPRWRPYRSFLYNTCLVGFYFILSIIPFSTFWMVEWIYKKKFVSLLPVTFSFGRVVALNLRWSTIYTCDVINIYIYFNIIAVAQKY